jgi:hypothetical protein
VTNANAACQGLVDQKLLQIAKLTFSPAAMNLAVN